jgi:transposase-like protein
MDEHASYPPAIADLKSSGELGRHCRCWPCPCLNNVLEQDHRFVKKRIAAGLWFRSVDGALRNIEGYEAMKMIRNGEISMAGEGRHCWAGPVHRRAFGTVV